MDKIAYLTDCEVCGTEDNVKCMDDPYTSMVVGDFYFLWLCPKCARVRERQAKQDLKEWAELE